jgi:hypothetical protein
MTKTRSFALTLIGAVLLSGAAFAQSRDGGNGGGGGSGGGGGRDNGDPVSLLITTATAPNPPARGRAPRGRAARDRDDYCVTQGLTGSYSDAGNPSGLCPRR